VQKIRKVVIIQVPNPKKRPNKLPEIKPIKGKKTIKLYIKNYIDLFYKPSLKFKSRACCVKNFIIYITMSEKK
jgi:hypothetical protein